MNQAYDLFLHQLRLDLQQPLPGRAAQLRMAPLPRPISESPYDEVRDDARRSGVLVLLYPRYDQLHLPLILRSTYNGVHSGQVSFPGGRFEEGDADLTATALREAYEEIGVAADQLKVLGQLSSLYIFPSNSLVHPTVAWTPQAPAFKIDPYEVAQLLEVPLLDLLNPDHLHHEVWELRGRAVDVPFYAIQGQKIWGATAMMLSELLVLPAMQYIPRSQRQSTIE